ncbi:methyltransferase [candidate division KSB1 bacterium]|nr:methyltransferase [candidate division KSB1 bacterium]
MIPRERVKTALHHQVPDKIPIDFSSTAVTGIHVTVVAALRDRLDLEKIPVKVWEPYQMLGWLDEDLKAVLGIDVEGIFSLNTLFGFPNENWKPFRTPWGQEVLVPGQFNTTTAPSGELLIYPQGDTDAPPSGRMPTSSFYFDSIIRQHHFNPDGLNVEDNLEEFKPITERELTHLKREVARVRNSSRAIVGNLGGTGLGDIALVPAPFLKHPKGIRDVEEWYISTVTRQDYLHQIFSAQTEIALKNLRKIHTIVGDLIDVVFVCGTDFGTQTSSFCSPATFEALYAPYYKQINRWIHENTSWLTFKHSCGAVEAFMPLFIDAGFDIINPVQCSAAGMNPDRLKQRYGDKLVFWGGAIDTQKTLPFGSPESIRAEVLSRCEIFSKNGGFIFNAIHNIQPMTPVENIIAMFDALKEFNGEKGG